MGKKKSVTIGYWYGLGLHMGLCVGPIDALRKILGDGKLMWSGNVTANTTLAIDKPNLYGGEKKEGGVKGDLTVLLGAADQAPNAYLISQLGTPMPAFRGLVTLVYKGLISAMNPYIKPWSFQVSRWTAGWRTAVWESALCKIGDGANPAHIIYRALTDPVTGLGLDPNNSIDLVRHKAAAQALFNEGLGLNLKWSRSEVVGNFIGMVCDHVGGTMATDPSTGLQYLKLYRPDYDIATVPLIDETNIVDLDSYEQAALAGSVNQVIVTFHDLDTNKDVPVTVSNLASIQAQGRTVTQATTYAGIGTAALAQRLAQRDLGNFSSLPARLKCTVQSALDVRKGDVVAFSWAKLNLVRMPMRIMDIDRGSVGDGRLVLTCVQDTTAVPTTTYVVQQPPLWVAPNLAPLPSPAVRVDEVPYQYLVATLDDYSLSQITSSSGYVSALGVRPTGVTYDYDLQTKINAGGTYVTVASGGFTPTGTLAAALPAAAGPSTVTLAGAIDLDLVAVGDAALIDVEICRVTAVDPAAGTCTLARGCADTVPALHALGARVWFSGTDRADDPTEYLTGETIYGRLLTRAGEGLLDPASAPSASILLAGRQAKPYPPAGVKINGTAYPAAILGAYAISWTHRDRITQADQLVDTTAASIGPETGTTYTLRLYGETDTLLRTVTGLTGTSYTWTAEEADSGLTIPGSPGYTFNEDLFDTDTTAQYTQSSDSAGTWAIAGGELVATGGSQSVFIRNGASYADVKIEADVNYATDGGLVLRFVDNNNYYLLTLSDDSGANPATNLRLFKRVAGTFTQLSSYDMSWTRGVSKVIRFGAAGTTISASVDGTQVISVTDSAISGPGGVGMRISGSGQQAKYQAFRWDIQGSPLTRLNGRIRAELESVRDGLVSHQMHNITTDRAGWGYQWGNYWGGV